MTPRLRFGAVPFRIAHEQKNRRVVTIAVLALALCALRSFGAPPPQQNGSEKQTFAAVLTNNDVLSMVKAGLSSAVVIAKIRSSASDFDTSPTTLGNLKKAGVPDSVILVMVQAPTAHSSTDNEVPPEPTQPASGNSTSPEAASKAPAPDLAMPKPRLPAEHSRQASSPPASDAAKSFPTPPPSAQPQDPAVWRTQMRSGTTLGTVRRLFLNQRVIISGAVVNLNGSVLLEWEQAHATGADQFGGDLLQKLPSGYKGKAATVIAVQINELKRRELKPNALGEVVAEDSIVDPYFDIGVRFDDGRLAMCTGYPNTISDDIEMASAASAIADEMSKQLPTLVGKTVYAVGYSSLYQPDSSLEEMAGLESTGSMKRLSSNDVPLLAPLEIVAARYIDSTGVVFKLKLPDGKEALSFTPQQYYVEEDANKPLNVMGTLLSEIPKTLTQKEIGAIKGGTIYKGMGKEATDYLLGFSEKENDWGAGGKQLVYVSGRVIVYLDRDGKVSDWQILDKN